MLQFDVGKQSNWKMQAKNRNFVSGRRQRDTERKREREGEVSALKLIQFHWYLLTLSTVQAHMISKNAFQLFSQMALTVLGKVTRD